jgi:ABC-type nitrate/sulfonate/bicarbonate transport system substrate-binding protein
MRQRARFIVALAATLVIASCGGDDHTGSTEAATSVTTTAPALGEEVVAGAPIPPSRCETNRAAGTITYLSGFDFAATASIIDVVMADERGYFDDLCLDVELQPSFSTDNYPIVASGDAQFASGGSFSEVVNFAAANEADLVAVAVEGRSAIDCLIVKPGVAERLEDLAGTTIGVKGKLAPSLAAMLASVGMVEGEDYETVLIDGFDPLVHIELPGIVGFTAYKSNEPGTLERAGVDFDLFAPSNYGIPGSFGVLYTTRRFIDEHPTAVQDFVRASMRGLADAMADPEGAAATAVERVEAGGNPNFLSLEGETFRWTTDVKSIKAETPEGTGVGVPDPALLQAEVDAYAEVGLFGDAGAPEIADRYDVDLIAGVYDDSGAVIWPAP